MLPRIGSSSARLLLRRRQRAVSKQSISCLQQVPFYSTSSSCQSDQEGSAHVHRLPPLSNEAKEKVDRIFQKILWLDMIEVHHLTEIVNQKMGIYLTDKQRAQIQKQIEQQAGVSSQATGASAAAEAEEADTGPKTVDLKLAAFDAKSKIKVIKEVRTIAGLGLKEAKELVESAPKIIQKDLKPEVAEELKKKLEEVGAEIELV